MLFQSTLFSLFKRRFFFSPFCLLLIGVLSGCGYQWGSQKPPVLTSVHSLYVPLALNDTLNPLAASLLTNSMVDALSMNGTYRVNEEALSDARLELSLKKISNAQVASSRLNTLRPEEIVLYVDIDWKLIDRRSGELLKKGRSRGHSNFFARGNFVMSEENALPDALERASQKIVTALSYGL